MSRFARRRASWMLVVVAALLAGNAQASKEKLDADVQTALKSFAEKIPAAPDLMQKAAGILVFPSVFKAGFMFGGTYGEGALQVHGQTVQYYRTTAVSWGFQAGLQSRVEIVLFMTQDALDRFRAGSGWQAGVDGSIALLAFGVGNSIDTDNIREPIIGFVFDDKGLMFDLSFKGNKYWKIDNP